MSSGSTTPQAHIERAMYHRQFLYCKKVTLSNRYLCDPDHTNTQIYVTQNRYLTNRPAVYWQQILKMDCIFNIFSLEMVSCCHYWCTDSFRSNALLFSMTLPCYRVSIIQTQCSRWHGVLGRIKNYYDEIFWTCQVCLSLLMIQPSHFSEQPFIKKVLRHGVSKNRLQ